MTNHQNKCFISLVIKALEIKKKFKSYTSEKEYAKAENKNAELNKPLCTKFSESFNSVLKAQRRNEKKVSFFNKILVEDSSEYFILKSVLGFLGGLFLTYICFLFLVFSLNFTLKRATYICIGLGVILSLGLAFSVKIRCTVFLCIPQLFSKRGRQALLAYAFILALSGPAKNTLHNVEVMSESLACTQEQLKQAENELSKYVQKPNAAAKRSIEKLLEKINCAVKDFKHFILQLYKTCFDILQTVFQAQKWLYSITLLCHKQMGKPAHRCLNLLAETMQNCEASIPFEPWKNYCKLKPSSQSLICSVKEESVCKRSDLPEFLPVLTLQKQLKDFKHRAMNVFYVSIESHQTYSQTNRSCTYHEEYQGMATEIRQKTDQFLQYFDFMSLIFGIFILVLFIKVIIYRHKFLTQDHFDNRYITNDFVDIDNTRAAFQMETLLPLTCKERMQYIKVWSVRLVPSERVQLFSSFVFLIFATFKIIIHMLTDSSLYWILSTVRREERLLYISTIRESQSTTTVRVVGHGLVAALIRNMTRAVRKESLVGLDPTPCLPDPVPPDWNRYCQIIALVIICWLLALCEPYGLRLRHAVMVTYHPDRARERAIWLYNRIISSRNSFVKASRRRLRRKYKDIAWEKTFCYKFMRKASSPKCLLCQSTIYSFDNYVKCSSVKCLGLYCANCFAKLKLCSICSDPAKYGDLSDLSEEKDSSEEELQKEEVVCKSPKKRDPRLGKKKEGATLHLKKFGIKPKKFGTPKDSEKCKVNRLVQPTLLFRALRLCKDKVFSLGHFRNFSDVESSDWDNTSLLITDESSKEDNPENLSDENNERKAGNKKTSRSKSSEKSKKSHENKNLKNPTNPKNLVQKVCLFKKISSMDSPAHTFKMNFEAFTSSRGKLISVGDSKEIKDGFDIRLDEDSSQKSKLLKAKDSIQLLKIKKKYNVEKTSLSISKEEVILSSRTEKDENFDFKNSDNKIIFNLLEKKNINLEKPEKVFPFIDPINVHEFDPGEDTEEENLSFKTASENSQSQRSLNRRKAKSVLFGKPTYFTPKHIRLCHKYSSSSDSTPENIRICIEEETESSSVESRCDCQFYTEPYHPPGSYLSHTESKSSIKRVSAKLNLTPKTRKHGAFYSVETDSSNDNFLSVKTSSRMRKKPKKCNQTEKKPDEILKLLASSSPAVQSKRNDFFKAKVYQFYKKNLRERKSSAENGSSDIDDVECTPSTAILLSDEEFQKLSKQISSRNEKKLKTYSKHLSEAPNLLSESPSCRK